MIEGDGTKIKAGLDKVWVIIKLMPKGREGTEAGWIKYVLDRTPASLSMEYLLPAGDDRVQQAGDITLHAPHAHPYRVSQGNRSVNRKLLPAKRG